MPARPDHHAGAGGDVMCRSDIQPEARQAMAAILGAIARALADAAGVTLDEVVIGPVDFGGPE